MDDAISRSAVLEEIYEMDISDCTDVEDIIDKAYAMIADAPALDAVPVIRCKDCKHWKPCAGATEHVKCCEWAGYMIGENGYCVYGEVKSDG